MIEVKIGNCLDVTNGIIIHGCNTHGVMGSGIALEIKNKFPEAFYLYHKKYKDQGNKLQLGDIIPVKVDHNKYIINAITQQNYGRSGNRFVSYDAIQECFFNLVSFINTLPENTLPIIFPLIGAGLGGGNWNIIEKIIDETVPDSFKKILYKLS